MSRIREREAAINRATSLFEMKDLDERILRLGALDDLTDGDEKRAVRMAHDKVWDLFKNKCQQLAVGKYKLTSKYGNTYILELTNEIYKDDTYIARIYKNNSLLVVDKWFVNGVGARTMNAQYTNTWLDDITIDIWPTQESHIFEWGGTLEKNPECEKYIPYYREEGTAEKIK